MKDVFCEHMVKRQLTPMAFLKLVAIGALMLALPLSAIFIFNNFQILFLALAFSVWGGIVLIKQCFEEFEYQFTNGELDFDHIIGKQRRKRVLTVDTKRTVLLVPDRAEFAEKLAAVSVVKTFDFTGGSAARKSRRYVLVAAGQLGNAKIFFEPSEELLLCISKFARSEDFHVDERRD